MKEFKIFKDMLKEYNVVVEIILEYEKVEKVVKHLMSQLREQCTNTQRLNNIIDEARKYIENNQSGGETNGHFHINFDGDIWELYEMLRRF